MEEVVTAVEDSLKGSEGGQPDVDAVVFDWLATDVVEDEFEANPVVAK